jgi:hypothetical protein
MGGRAAKLKGNRAERNLVKTLQLAGIAAERTPLSGAVRSSRFGGGYDVRIPFGNQAMRAEVKHHANGFRRLYKWLQPVDIVVVKADYSEPLAILPLKRLMELIELRKSKKD